MNKILILILLIIPLAKAEIIITEIMADPIRDETLNEWIELYNNGTEAIDLKDWQIGDNKDNDTLEGGLYDKKGTILPSQNYAIITDDMTRVYNNFNINQNVTKLYVDGSTIGNGLRNSGETIWLYNSQGEMVNEATYDKTKEGQSYSLQNNSWQKTEPTPGYSSRPKIGCDWKIEIITNQTAIEKSEFKIKVQKIYGEKNNITLNRNVKNLFGETIKEYTTLEINNALNYRTYKYSPKLKTNQAYKINAEINSSCDINHENNIAEKIIFVQSGKPKEESEIEIIKIYDLGKDKEAKWGQIIKIRLKIYKGNTNKKTINIWAEKEKEKASKQTRINLETKYTTTELTIPIFLKPNCDKKLKNGEYKIIAEGIDSRSMKKIITNGELKDICKIIKEKEIIIKNNQTCNITEQKITEQNMTIKTNNLLTNQKKENQNYINKENITKITGNTVYESKNQKVKKIGIYFYIGVLMIITIASIIKK